LATFIVPSLFANKHDGDGCKGSIGTITWISNDLGQPHGDSALVSRYAICLRDQQIRQRWRTDMGYIKRFLTALSFGTLLTVSAHAQLTGYYPFGSDALSLSNDDFMRLIDAANRLLVRSPLPVGTTTSWRNDQTGSVGTIRVERTFRHDSMLCHRLVYETMPGGTPPANRTALDWCNTRDGWKILSS
jgi:surface antigen